MLQLHVVFHGKTPLLYKRWYFVLWCTLLISEGKLFSFTECRLGAGGPGPLLQCLSVQPLVHSAAWKTRAGLSSHQFLCRITFLPSDGSFFWLCWHESSDTPMFSWAINLSCCLWICVSWQLKRSRCLVRPVPRRFANPGAPGPLWHCSMWPIVRDPGSGGNSWWILQYLPAWHKPYGIGLNIHLL